MIEAIVGDNGPEPVCPHPEASGKRWGDPISEERQHELRTILDAWNMPGADHDKQMGPFDGVSLTGAEVSWLAEHARNSFGSGSDLHLEGATLDEAHLEGATLYQAHLERATLSEAHLERATLSEAHLSADLSKAYLQRADLSEAHLESAVLSEALLKGATFYQAHLEGATLDEAHLQGVDLREAFLDTATSLHDVIIRSSSAGCIRVADIRWGGVNLAAFKGDLRPPLGDEQAAHAWRFMPLVVEKNEHISTRAQYRKQRAEQQRTERLDLFRAAVRANRQLAVALQDQGMGEEAARFAYRAQVLQRTVYRLRGWRSWERWFFSGLLDGLAGYGYRPERSVGLYLVIIILFTSLYYWLGAAVGPHLSPYEALIVSVTAFHGRGFFATTFQPGDPQAGVAALEAVIGLLIEISFIATFTQRFFAR